MVTKKQTLLVKTKPKWLIIYKFALLLKLLCFFQITYCNSFSIFFEWDKVPYGGRNLSLIRKHSFNFLVTKLVSFFTLFQTFHKNLYHNSNFHLNHFQILLYKSIMTLLVDVPEGFSWNVILLTLKILFY